MFFKKGPQLIPILLFNLIPIIGVAYYNWSPFEMFWLFWMETLIISFFNAIRVLFSQGKEEGSAIENHSIKLQLSASFKFLMIRLAIFFFYALFIVVFIGFMPNREEETVHTVRTLAFQNLLFNLALLVSIAFNTLYLVKYFFANGAFRTTKVSDYPGIFDGRQIVIHIAVVLGAVGSSFLLQERGNAQYSSLWIIAIFCIVKCVFELYTVRGAKSTIIHD